MAGAGWRDFVTGEVVTEPYIQTYLQDQAVMVFATTAARDTAITSPAAGMHAWVSANNALYRYHAAAWVLIEGWGTGTPEGAVTATKGAIWHQTDGAAAAIVWVKESDTTNTGWVKPIMGSVGTAKGDLIGFSGSGAVLRQAVGVDGQFLKADSAQTNGLAWGDAPASALSRSGGNTTVASTTSATMADVLTASGLSIAAANPILIVASLRRESTDTHSANWGLKLNTTVLRDDVRAWTAGGGGANQPISVYIYVPPRLTNFLKGSWAQISGMSAGTAFAEVQHLNTTDAPTATITSVAIRASAATAGTVYVDELHVYSLAVS